MRHSIVRAAGGKAGRSGARKERRRTTQKREREEAQEPHRTSGRRTGAGKGAEQQTNRQKRKERKWVRARFGGSDALVQMRIFLRQKRQSGPVASSCRGLCACVWSGVDPF